MISRLCPSGESKYSPRPPGDRRELVVADEEGVVLRDDLGRLHEVQAHPVRQGHDRERAEGLRLGQSENLGEEARTGPPVRGCDDGVVQLSHAPRCNLKGGRGQPGKEGE